ncbi:MAG: hypothetical protein ACOYBO_13350 [Azonexus sp.]
MNGGGAADGALPCAWTAETSRTLAASHHSTKERIIFIVFSSDVRPDVNINTIAHHWCRAEGSGRSPVAFFCHALESRFLWGHTEPDGMQVLCAMW